MSSQQFFKFLAGNLASGHDSEFYYNAPVWAGKRWKPGPWVEAKEFEEGGYVCGKGLHLMKHPNPRYIQYSGNAYVAEGEGLLAEDEEKARFKRVRLIRPLAFKEIFHEKANLYRANLSEANLYGANLSGANLYGAVDLTKDQLKLALHGDKALNVPPEAKPSWWEGAYWN